MKSSNLILSFRDTKIICIYSLLDDRVTRHTVCISCFKKDRLQKQETFVTILVGTMGSGSLSVIYRGFVHGLIKHQTRRKQNKYIYFLCEKMP